MVKKINWLLVIGMIIGVFCYTMFKYEEDRLLTYLAVIPVSVFPFLFSRTKLRLSDKNYFYYYVFIFFAYFIGSVVNLYNTIWWYDIFVHFSSGIFSFMMGLFLYNRLSTEKNSLFFKILFSFCVVMAVAGLWELFEFIVDTLLGLDLQYSSTGVMDTMIDILVAFIGGIISIVIYYIIDKK